MGAKIREAGEKLRDIRRKVGISNIESIDSLTEEKLGPDLVMHFPQLGRIERGILKRPPSAEDLAILGMMYGLTPAELFELYGLPVYGVSQYEKRRDPRVARLEQFVASLPEDSPAREQLLQWVTFAIVQAQQMLEKEQEARPLTWKPNSIPAPAPEEDARPRITHEAEEKLIAEVKALEGVERASLVRTEYQGKYAVLSVLWKDGSVTTERVNLSSGERPVQRGTSNSAQ